MALTTYTITGTASDLIGTPHEGGHDGDGTLLLMIEQSETILGDDSTGNIRVGKRYHPTIGTGGSITFPGLPATTAGFPLYRLVGQVLEPGKAPSKFQTGWFELTINRTLAWVIENTVVPEIITPEMATKIREASAALSGEDSAVAYLVANPSETQTALETAIEDGIQTSPTYTATVTGIEARARLATPGATAADNRAIIQAALTEAASAGAPLALRGSFPLTGGVLIPPSAVRIDATQATLTQTDNLQPILRLPSGSRLSGGHFVGKGTDWVNNSSVYSACAVALASSATDVILDNVRGSNLAGAGVYAASGVSDVRLLFCDFEGVGSSIIPASTGQYSGGVIINNNDSSDISIVGGAYRGFAQGIHSGTVDDLFIGGGVTLNAVGQHAIYLGPIQSGVISGFIIESAALEGIKTQIAPGSGGEPGALFHIGQGSIRGCGSHLIHLANSEAVPATRHRRVIVSDILGEHSPGYGGDTVLLEHVSEATVHDVISTGGHRVLRALECIGLDVHHIRGNDYAQSGIHLNNVTDSTFDQIRLVNGSTANNVNEEWGIHVTGASSANLRFSNSRITDGLGNTAFLVRIVSGDLGSMSFVNLVGSGATSHGFRSHVSTATALWSGNNLQGASGKFFNTPANAGPIADTSGAALAALEAEVNKLKARLRETGVVN